MKKIFFFCAFLLFAQYFLSVGQVKITFKTGNLPASKGAGEHLFIAGDFNGWNPAANAWQLLPNGKKSYALSATLVPGNYSFKVTRGNWDKVESTGTGNAVDNRLLKIMHDTTVVLNVDGWQDQFAKVEKPHTASAQVHIVSDKFEMPQLGRTRRVWIYLPPGYESGSHKYPVIYMHDGQNLFDEYTSGYGEWGIDELMDKLPAKDQSIIVGIDHGGDYRITEYDPYDSKYGKGRGDDYVEFLVKTLKPYIDSHYRTQTNARHTTIAGSSMGGLISMYAALKYPNVFGKAGIFSPAFWIAPEIYTYTQNQQVKTKARFYFVCGDAESETMVTDMKKMADLLHANGISTQNAPVTIVKDAKHNEQQWHGDFPAFYQWVLLSPKE